MQVMRRNAASPAMLSSGSISLFIFGAIGRNEKVVESRILTQRTRRQALLQLLGLLSVLENQGVEVSLAADLELDVVALLVLLDPRG